MRAAHVRPWQRTCEPIDVSTVCRACRQLRLLSKKLCHYQARRDEFLARTFVEGVVNDYEARMHLHVDETAKDGRVPLGAPAICSVGYFGLHSRKRLSYLVSSCAISQTVFSQLSEVWCSQRSET